MTTLFTFRREDVSLLDAVEAWKIKLGGAMGILYSAQECRVLPLDSLAHGTMEQQLKCAPFEARVFNKDYELRWVASTERFVPDDFGKIDGSAVVLTECESAIPNHWCPTDKPEILGKCDRFYILWGTAVCRGEALSLTDHRVGELAIPLAAFGGAQPKDGGRGTIKVREYIAVDDGHGNCAVVAERLCGWGRVDEESR